MEVIQKIPYIFSLISSLIVSIVSLSQRIEFREICLRVSVTLITFYIIGILVKKVLTEIIQQIEQEEQEKQELLEQNQENNDGNNNQKDEQETNKEDSQEDDQEDNQETESGFSPLDVEQVSKNESKVISNML